MHSATKRTKIVSTIGPASSKPRMFANLVQAGLDVARLNFSHGTHPQHQELFRMIRATERVVDRPIGILQDLQGPKIRVGDLPKEGIRLVDGVRAVFSVAAYPEPGDIPVTLKTLARDVKPGARLLLDDGLLEVEVQRVSGSRVITEVVHGGILTSHKGLNLPGTSLKIPALSEKDEEDARFGAKLGVDFIALSFVRRAADVQKLRHLLARATSRRIPIVAKIEKPEAVENFEEILEEVDVIMVARGDLGIEIAAEKVPVVQKQIISACRERGIPVIVATQMLDSMQRNPRPTRAEVSDVANAVADHADAVMLSGETATGAYPLEAVRMMAETIQAMEASIFDDVNPFRVSVPHSRIQPIGAAIRLLSDSMGLAPIVIDGQSPELVNDLSAMRPEAPLHVAAPTMELARRYAMTWGAMPQVVKDVELLAKRLKFPKGQLHIRVEEEEDGVDIEVKLG